MRKVNARDSSLDLFFFFLGRGVFLFIKLCNLSPALVSLFRTGILHGCNSAEKVKSFEAGKVE